MSVLHRSRRQLVARQSASRNGTVSEAFKLSTPCIAQGRRAFVKYVNDSIDHRVVESGIRAHKDRTVHERIGSRERTDLPKGTRPVQLQLDKRRLADQIAAEEATVPHAMPIEVSGQVNCAEERAFTDKNHEAEPARVRAG